MHLHSGTPPEGWFEHDGRPAYGNRDDVAVWAQQHDVHLMAPDGVDPVLLRLLLLGAGLSMALIAEGLPLLHATTVRLESDVAICGASGVGKSSFTAALLARGATLVADDLTALDQGCVRIGIPRIKLWRDAALHFGHDPEGLERVHPAFEKFSLRVPVVEERRPLRRIAVLQQGSQEIRRLRGNEALTTLLANHRLPQVLTGASELRWLQACTRLVDQVEVFEVGLPGSLQALEAQADRLANLA